jgi:hypothetical protein
MQLNKPQSIRAALAAATCTVLAQPLQAQQEPIQWNVDSGLLFYNEADGRISVVEPVLSASKVGADGSILTLRGVFDSVTGASPNGATPTDSAQTFTSPSGNSSYTVAAGDTPMREITDTRAAFALDWDRELTRLIRNSISGNISAETDYLSLGIADNLKVDVNNRRTTLVAGIGLSFDAITPSGGTPVGLQLLSTPAPIGDGEGEDDGEHKVTTELLFGVTHVLSRQALTQLNYSYSYSDGYLTDPCKVLSVVDGTSGATLDYRYEKRPSSRQANSLLMLATIAMLQGSGANEFLQTQGVPYWIID